MDNFASSAYAYSPMPPPYPDDAGLPTDSPPCILVAIKDIEPCSRELKRGISDSPLFATEERLVRILSGFKNDDRIPPIWIYEADTHSYRYKIHHGAHRFYASVAAGFSHIPAVVIKPFRMADIG